MKILFTAWLLINGQWIHGSHFDGWWPVETETMEKCQQYLKYAEQYGPDGVKFTCEVQ